MRYRFSVDRYRANERNHLTTSFTMQDLNFKGLPGRRFQSQVCVFFRNFCAVPGPISINGLFWGHENWKSVKGFLLAVSLEQVVPSWPVKIPNFWVPNKRHKKLEESLPLRDRKTTPPSFKGGPACRLSIVGFWGGHVFLKLIYIPKNHPNAILYRQEMWGKWGNTAGTCPCPLEDAVMGRYRPRPPP